MDITDTARIVLPLAPAPALCPGREAPSMALCPRAPIAAPREIAPASPSEAVAPGGWWAFCAAAAAVATISC